MCFVSSARTAFAPAVCYIYMVGTGLSFVRWWCVSLWLCGDSPNEYAIIFPIELAVCIQATTTTEKPCMQYKIGGNQCAATHALCGGNK